MCPCYLKQAVDFEPLVLWEPQVTTCSYFFLFTVKHEEKLQSGLDQTREFAVTSWAQRPVLPVGDHGIHDPTVASVEEGVIPASQDWCQDQTK